MIENQVLLHNLPPDHTDRNRPLIGCYYKWKFGVMWNQIKAPYGIAIYTYNQLSEGWTDNDYFTWDAPDGR